jgi:hypothetical protein
MKKHAWLGLLFTLLLIAGCSGGGGDSFGQFDPQEAQARMQERYNAMATAVQQRNVDGVMANLSPDFLHDGITRQAVQDRLTAAATEYANVDAGFTVKSIRLQGKTAYVTTEYHLAGDVVAQPGTRKTGDGTMEVRWCHELNDWYITGNLQQGSGGPPAWPF